MVAAPVPKGVRSHMSVDCNGSGVPCPKCHGGTRVIDSRPAGNDSLRRRRICTVIGCAHRFTTYEIALEQAPMVNFAKFSDELVDRLRGNVTLLQQIEEIVLAAKAIATIDDRR